MNRMTFRWIVLVLILLVFAALWRWLPRGDRPKLGVVQGQFTPCPDSPNAVSSQSDSPIHRIDPIPFPIAGDPGASLEQVRLASLAEPGMSLMESLPGYLRFEVTTRILRFVDDLEWYADPQDEVIHVRSASRIGHSDLGANRRRVERIRARLKTGLRQSGLDAP
jgi:uncharacterized protein (DUF1499 family)